MNHGQVFSFQLALQRGDLAAHDVAPDVDELTVNVTPLQACNLALAKAEEVSEGHDELTMHVVNEGRDDVFDFSEAVIAGLPIGKGLAEYGCISDGVCLVVAGGNRVCKEAACKKF